MFAINLKRIMSNYDPVVLCALLVFAVVARVTVALSYEVNWDEFYYLSAVHRFINGDTLINSFQTFHIHFFTWLDLISNNEVGQIVAARFAMLALQIITGFYIFRICRRYLSFSASIFAVLSYFSFSYVIRMGASFRTDPIASCFLIIVLDYFLSNKLSVMKSLIAGVLTAFALLISLKASLYIPTFLSIVLITLYCSESRRNYIRQLLFYGVSILIGFSALYIWHYSSIGGSSLLIDIFSMTGAADKTLNERTFFHGEAFFIQTLTSDSIYWLILLVGSVFAAVSAFNQSLLSRDVSLKYLSVVLLLTTLLYYRNSFPYYYAFMLAPVSILFAVFWDGLFTFIRTKLAHFVSLTILLLFSFSIVLNGFVVPLSKDRNLDYQRYFIETVHEIFTEPVSYIDRCSMIASYTKTGFFMSTWRYENYVRDQQPVIHNAVLNDNPVFVVANTPFLSALYQASSDNWLITQDRFTLQQNYIHHWNELFVAGKQFELSINTPSVEFSLYVEGIYTLEGDSNAKINGSLLSPGQTIFLSKGVHVITSDQLPGTYTIRWGDNLLRPTERIKSRALFTGF
ncbi:ArnT family glycosyltransferase [Vibrio sp. WJH972]